MRPRCDPFDAPAIRTAIAKGETTERRAYEAYAATAARPYARSSFEVCCGRGNRFEQSTSTSPYRIDPRIDCPRSRLLEQARRASQALERPHTDRRQREPQRQTRRAHRRTRRASLVYEPRAVKPSAIVMTGWGGVITLAALRFCAHA